MTAVQQLVIGIFQDRTQAEQAIDELARAGFDHQQIHFAGPGLTVSTGGVLEKIKSLFTGQDVSAGWLYDDLARVGLPPEETRYYQSEFEAGRSVVAVQGNVGMQMASLILARHGGYGANQRVAQSAGYGTPAGAQEAAPAYDANQRVAQSAGYGTPAGAQEAAPAYDANQHVAQPADYGATAGAQEAAPAHDANQHVAQSTDSDKGTGAQEAVPDDDANQRVAHSADTSQKADQEPTNKD
jgi:hypothetical protein